MVQPHTHTRYTYAYARIGQKEAVLLYARTIGNDVVFVFFSMRENQAQELLALRARVIYLIFFLWDVQLLNAVPGRQSSRFIFPSNFLIIHRNKMLKYTQTVALYRYPVAHHKLRQPDPVLCGIDWESRVRLNVVHLSLSVKTRTTFTAEIQPGMNRFVF